MDRPILFSAPMVRALLAGTKTQTRRVLKPQPYLHNVWQCEDTGSWWQSGYGESGDDLIDLRIQSGDRLWVRESGQLLREAYDHDPRCSVDLWRDAGFYHSADGEIIEARSYDPPLAEWADDCSRVNRPSIHMPRWASRLTLTVTDVRVQRLQDISEEDAIAEGTGLFVPGHGFITDSELRAEPGYANFLYARAGFEAIWTEINGTGSWAANPWIAAYTFTVERRNIDEGLGQRADATQNPSPIQAQEE